jgi:4-diphosphocytidyl-2-C-methyl-D-erythritol kinase
VSTAAAFLGIKPVFRENSIDELASLPLQDWKKELHNDFEESVFELYPEIQDIRNILYRNGAIYAAMSGSGSAVFGLFVENPGQINFEGCDVFRTLLGSQF